MILYCLLFGRKPESFYSIYRTWYKRQHGYDVDLATLPFIPPSSSNFLYDPFTVDVDNPFNVDELMINDEVNITGSL